MKYVTRCWSRFDKLSILKILKCKFSHRNNSLIKHVYQFYESRKRQARGLKSLTNWTAVLEAPAWLPPTTLAADCKLLFWSQQPLSMQASRPALLCWRPQWAVKGTRRLDGYWRGRGGNGGITSPEQTHVLENLLRPEFLRIFLWQKLSFGTLSVDCVAFIVKRELGTIV